MPAHTADWWLERLEGVVEKGPNEWAALCPAHNDANPSLHVSIVEDGSTLVHCFAGCEYGEIIQKVEDSSEIKLNIIRVPSHKNSPGKAGDWWSSYTGVPSDEWESWGTSFDDKNKEVIFSWEGSKLQKRRKVGTKEFYWTPKTGSNPPLWPKVPESLPKDVYITEGESDCGVLRYIGLTAFAITKGSGYNIDPRIWAEMYSRGARRITLCMDADEAGRKGSVNLAQTVVGSGIDLYSIDMTKMLDPMMSEKDIRDLWLRLLDPEDMIQSVLSCSSKWSVIGKGSLVSISEFMETQVPENAWDIENVWLSGTVGMLVGYPKMGKSWLALDMALSLSTGTPFLGEFEVNTQSPVVYIAGEDSANLLQDRLYKIMRSKGLSGKNEMPKIVMPPSADIPMYVDLSRSFMFTDEERVEILMKWLRHIHDVYGELSLVIFDPILRMLGGVDEFKASEVASSVFKVTELIRRETGAGSLLVHHKNKGATEGKGSYGSIGFHAFSEASLYIQGAELDDGWADVKSEYKSAPESIWSYRMLDLQTGYRPQVIMGPRQDSNIDRVKVAILSVVHKSAMSVEAIATILDTHQGQIREALRVLEEEGVVIKEKLPVNGKGRPGNGWIAVERNNV